MSTASKDRFIAIAECEDVVLPKTKFFPLIEPREYVHESIQSCEPREVEKYLFDEEKERFELDKELAVLRKRYEPFLKDVYSLPDSPNEHIDLDEFDFRLENEEDKKDFSRVLGHKGTWEKVQIPHFVGPEGEYCGFYFKKLDFGSIEEDKSYLLRFEASDYLTEVYINGRMVVSHEGFFAPFSADITGFIHEGTNHLLVVVHNDFTTRGNSMDGKMNYGNKIYAATHFGYDEPTKGWHHCPSGIGIYGRVGLDIKNKVNFSELYLRPNIDERSVSGSVSIHNFNQRHVKNAYLRVSIVGKNFEATVISNQKKTCDPLQIGENTIDFSYSIPEMRLWELEHPYLYEMIVELFDEHDVLLDTIHDHFGMRKFSMDENSKPRKGLYYFNNERIILNGANEMGNLVLSVNRGDEGRLIDDILLAKAANLNFYRMTQRPVPRKIYDFFDMLGMLCQTDFPLFSFLTPGALGAAYKQVDEMERLVRNHPCCIIDTFCNECMDAYSMGVSQYVLDREDMEKAFTAFRKIVLLENPDRVVKIHEGDYAPLEECWGNSDFHCYTYWYPAHGVYGGLFNKGFIPGNRTDWMSGCGEYGVDGLDSYELMKKHCPKEWMPEHDDDLWTPKSIPMSQAWAEGSNFYPEQEHIRDWIRESRAYQAIAIKDYVDNLRRRTDIVQSRAVHILIDAWPCGWTKALVDVDRNPKPAFYAFKKACVPFRVSLRCDRRHIYNDEALTVEAFALNDFPKAKEGDLLISIYEGDSLKRSYSKKIHANASIETYLGDVNYQPSSGYVGPLSVRAKLVDEDKTTDDEVEILVNSRVEASSKAPRFLGTSIDGLKRLFGSETKEDVIFTDSAYYVANKAELEEMAFRGARIVLFTEDSIDVLSDRVGFWKHPLPGMVKASNWLEVNKDSKFLEGIGEFEFKDLYDSINDTLNISCSYKFYWNGAEPLLYFRHDRGNPEFQFHKEKKFAVAMKKHGKGEIVVSTLSNINGFAGYNKAFDQFIINLATK